MMKILKSNGGFTLVELIVAMTIATVILTSVTAIFPAVLQTYEEANSLAERNTLMSNLANQIIADLADATEDVAELDAENTVTIATGHGVVTYTVDALEGVLLKKIGSGEPAAVLSKAYFKNKSARFIVSKADSHGTAYNLSVTIISDKSGKEISRNYTVMPLVLNQY